MEKKLDVDDWTINDIMELYKNGKLGVDQRYQRKLVWNLDDKVLFIDSLFRLFPIPNIMMVEYKRDDTIQYGIIDGLQRINAIISFMLGEFPVEVDGFKGYFDIKSTPETFDLYQEGNLEQKTPALDRQVCVDFRRHKLPIIITNYYDSKTVDEIFKRLNSTGTKLSRHDLRQAGALNRFSQLVREISSVIRGSKTITDIVALDIIPKISLSNKGLDYAINIDNVFWKKNGILTDDNLRKSRDEEIIAMLLGSFLLDRPVFIISPKILDNLYDENTEDGRIADEKLKNCYDNLSTLFVQIFNDISMMCDELKAPLSDVLFDSDKKKVEIFMLFYKVMLQVYFEGKAIGDYIDFANALKNSKKSFLDNLEERQYYMAETSVVKLMSDIIKSYLVPVDPIPNSTVTEVINRLNLASTETKYTEYKIGFTLFNTHSSKRYNEGKLNFKNVSQIAKVASAMANVKRQPLVPCFIIIGVADDETAYKAWSDYFGERAYKYNGHRVVGIDAEAKTHYHSIDAMLKAFRERIDIEPISNELKEDIKNYEIITIQKKTVVVITITAPSDQLYDGKKYIREGSDIKEIII